MQPDKGESNRSYTLEHNPHLLWTGSLAALGGFIIFSLIVWLVMSLFNIQLL